MENNKNDSYSNFATKYVPSSNSNRPHPVAKTLVNDSDKQKKIPFSVAEAYKAIRTNLVSILGDSGQKVFTVSSPNASEGKSTTSINVAISLSQINKRVLLVDADAHRPSIHNKLKLPNTDGLMNILLGISDFENAVHHYNSSLDILTSGPTPVNSTELFSDEAFDNLIEKLKPSYDYIIFDAPPVNLVSDALVIAQKCDGLVFIIRSGLTTFESLRRCLSSANVLNINILGVILNASETSSKHYYKYYKSYGYSNYNSYSDK